MDKRSYSQSMIRSSGCHRLFLSRLAAEKKGRIGSQSVLATLGTALHKFAEEYHGHCLARGVASDVTAARGMALRLAVGSGLDDQNQLELAWLAELLAEQETIHPDRPTRFETKLKAEDGRFYGTIDRATVFDDLVEITDYKSGWKCRSQAECERDIQLWFYAMLWLARWPETRRFRLRYVYLRAARDRAWEVSADQVRQFAAEMRVVADELDGVEEPTPCAGQLCDYCEVAVDCPLVVGHRIVAITSPEIAHRAAQALKAAKGAVYQLESRLRAWCEQNGPVALADGTTLAHHQKVGQVWPAAEVIGWFADNTNLEAPDILREFRIGKEGVARLARAAGLNKNRRQQLNSMCLAAPGSTFGFKKGRCRIEAQATDDHQLRGPGQGGPGPVERADPLGSW